MVEGTPDIENKNTEKMMYFAVQNTVIKVNKN